MNSKSISEFMNQHEKWRVELELLRSIILETSCKESIKWGGPCYSIDGKNIIGIGAFKHHFGLWFFQGVWLKDEAGILVNSQKEKTKSLRQIRFNSIEDIDVKLIKGYINEAIENQKNNKFTAPNRSRYYEIPKELADEFEVNRPLKSCFESLTNGRQKEYAIYISEAKILATRLKRLEKITPLILDMKGLYDEYKN